MSKSLKQFLLLMLMMALLLLTACSLEIDGGIQKDDSFKLEEAIQRGDVVDIHGQVYNYSNFTSFFSDVENQKSSTIRIARYTIEGDPIFYELDYDGTLIKLEIDNSKDSYRGNGPTKRKMTCSSQIVSTENNTKYFLKDCDENSEYGILVVSELKD